MPRSISIAMTTALCLQLATAAAAPLNSPEALVRAIYANHQPWNNREIDIDSPVALSNYFDDELTDLFAQMWARQARSHDVCGLDGDPFLDAQDYDEDLKPELRIRTLSTRTPVVVEATFRLFNNSTERRTLRYYLRKTGHGWKVTDIIYSGQPDHSLKQILIDSKKECPDVPGGDQPARR